MKPSPPVVVLCALSLATGAAFLLLRARAGAPAAAPAPEPGAPHSSERPAVAERRALPTAPLRASPAPEVEEERPSWTSLNNDAAELLARGDLAAAVALFERCVEAEPANDVFASNLAEALIRLALSEHEKNEIAPAVEHLARAIELDHDRPDEATLRELLERWRRELELEADDWTDGSDRFELSFDGDRTELLHHSHEVLEHLELAYADLVRWFGQDPFPDGPPIRVVLYQPADFDRLTGLGDWAAGLFDGVVRVSLKDLQGGSWRPVLVHELVHAFVQALGGTRVPGWLNEGLAQILEGRPDAIVRLGARLRGAELFPLERLGGSLAGWEDTAAIARAYAESLVFVDYLRQTYGDEALRRMVAGGRLGETPAEAFAAFTAVELAVAFGDWSESLER